MEVEFVISEEEKLIEFCLYWSGLEGVFEVLPYWVIFDETKFSCCQKARR